jgi:hypothetical protein
MKARRVVIPMLAACALATLAAPAGADHQPQTAETVASCVGLFASHAARELPPGEYGAGISAEAHFFQPFGRNRVAPFAHERLPCP